MKGLVGGGSTGDKTHLGGVRLERLALCSSPRQPLSWGGDAGGAPFTSSAS